MNDPIVHALVGSQYGDLEFDVGKSVRWTQTYADDLHVTDVNLGTQRYWVVNWALTFPDVKHTVVGINFFADPVAFRKRQWELAKKAFVVTPDDWVIFVDAHEGLSFDTTTLPDDYLVAPFMSWVYREIARAELAGNTSVTLPFFVFCESAEPQNVEFLGTGDEITGTLTARQTVSVPYYEANQGLTRMFQASALDDVDFDWTVIDQLSTPDVDVKAQIISYAYAHWQYLNIEDETVGVPPITEESDKGWEMRKQISRVRPLASFPTAVWNIDDQPAGLPGPWCVDTAVLPDPDLPDAIVEEFPHTTPDPTMAGLMTPLYDTVFRLNLRDGVWYESGVSGNIPLTWDSDAQDWITFYDPATWPEQGVGSYVENAPLTPIDVTATYVGPPHAALVMWSPAVYDFVLDPPVSGYLLEREVDSIVSTVGTFPNNNFPIEEATIPITAPTQFRVSALNGVGASEPSAWTAEVVPPAGDPE